MRKVRHIGLIPDGGRRWARVHNKTLLDSYLVAMDRLEEYCGTLYDRGIDAISIYMLSRWNLSRNSDELEAVFAAEAMFLEGPVRKLAREKGIRVVVAGDTSHLPMLFRQRVEAATSDLVVGDKRLFLCIAYDPFDELRVAARRLNSINQMPTGEELLMHMWVDRPIDLVIRTGGGQTLSHFLPLQTGYARLVLVDELFNDTTMAFIWSHVTRHESLDLKFGS